jgi:hypothetical protein
LYYPSFIKFIEFCRQGKICVQRFDLDPIYFKPYKPCPAFLALSHLYSANLRFKGLDTAVTITIPIVSPAAQRSASFPFCENISASDLCDLVVAAITADNFVYVGVTGTMTWDASGAATKIPVVVELQ